MGMNYGLGYEMREMDDLQEAADLCNAKLDKLYAKVEAGSESQKDIEQINAFDAYVSAYSDALQGIKTKKGFEGLHYCRTHARSILGKPEDPFKGTRIRMVDGELVAFVPGGLN